LPLVALSFSLFVPDAANAEPESLELQFGGPVRMGGPGPVPPDLLRLLSRAGSAAPGGGGSSSSTGNGNGNAREDELDRAISMLMGGGAGPLSSGMAMEGRLPDGSEIVFEAPSGGGQQVPMELLRGLFPGPLIVDQGGGGDDDDDPESAIDGPDPLIMDMMDSMGPAFQDQILPALHHSPTLGSSAFGRERPRGRNLGPGHAPNACKVDLAKHCARARSQLHCLGQHNADVSPECRKSVEKSVPYVCSPAIDRYCDVLQNGILTCLQGRLQELDINCRDAVLATQAVVSKVQGMSTTTSKAATVDTLAAGWAQARSQALPPTLQQQQPVQRAAITGNTFGPAPLPATVAGAAAQPTATGTSPALPVLLLLACGVFLYASVSSEGSLKDMYAKFETFVFGGNSDVREPLRGSVPAAKELRTITAGTTV